MMDIMVAEAAVQEPEGSYSAVTEFVNKIVSRPSPSLVLFYRLVAVGCAAIFVVIGAGYAVAGRKSITTNGLIEIQNLEGTLRVHGWTMIALAVALLVSLNGRRRVTRAALCGVFAYSFFTALEVFAGWHIVGVNWGWPFWYLFVAFLTFLLIVFCPREG